MNSRIVAVAGLFLACLAPDGFSRDPLREAAARAARDAQKQAILSVRESVKRTIVLASAPPRQNASQARPNIPKIAATSAHHH